jgi:hypothetical protein
MSVITEDVAAQLRLRGYDAAHDRWPTVEGVTQATDYVVVNAVTVIGWRYPTGDWAWDDRPSYLVDHGVDPPRRSPQPPHFESSQRWEWLPSQPGAPHEHPRDSASAAQIAAWIATRLPAPSQPICILLRHPNDARNQSDPAAATRSHPRPVSWPWTSDWEQAWADADEQSHS